MKTKDKLNVFANQGNLFNRRWFKQAWLRYANMLRRNDQAEQCMLQSSRFTSPRSTLQKPYVFCTMLQFCYVFYTTFWLSPLSLLLERCTKYMQYVQRYTICFVYCNIVRNALRTCNVVHFQCILCNVLRWGRVGIIKRLYKIHSKIATLYKIHRFFVTLI